MTTLTGILDKLTFSRRQPKFKTGDHVQRIEGSELMVVREVSVSKEANAVLLLCKWFDQQTRQNKQAFFRESEITFFNWYSANNKAAHHHVNAA